MKKIYLLVVILLILSIVLAVNFYFLNTKVFAPGSVQIICGKEGERVRYDGQGFPKDCCAGLKSMYGGAQEDCNLPGIPGDIATCSNCGNGICESKNNENNCNCPEDCKTVQKTFLTPKNDNELRACIKDTDCALVDAKSCCGCFDIVNKNYSDYWNQLEKGICPDGLACEECQYYKDDPKLKAICLEGKCNTTSIK